jgi:hypothetical protein
MTNLLPFNLGELPAPESTLWGEIQTRTEIHPGVWEIESPGHGGYMVAAQRRRLLTLAAQALAEVWSGYLCFEEDLKWAVLFVDVPDLREPMRKGRGCSIDRLKELAIQTLSGFHPSFLLDRGVTPEPTAYAAWHARQEELRRRQARDPDLIIGASSQGSEITQVATADGLTHRVIAESYRRVYAAGGVLLLSRCEIAPAAS